jgi:hypothetical protein
VITFACVAQAFQPADKNGYATRAPVRIFRRAGRFWERPISQLLAALKVVNKSQVCLRGFIRRKSLFCVEKGAPDAHRCPKVRIEKRLSSAVTRFKGCW